MQKHPQLTFIVRNPNGSIQLATQPHLSDLALLKCGQCGKVQPVRGTGKFTCQACGTAISANRCRQPGCAGQIEFVYIGGFIVKECDKCHHIEPVQPRWYLFLEFLNTFPLFTQRVRNMLKLKLLALGNLCFFVTFVLNLLFSKNFRTRIHWIHEEIISKITQKSLSFKFLELDFIFADK